MTEKSLLIVEDELGPRESLRIILKNTLRVSTVDSGKDALALLETRDFDLISIDLKLPDIAGLELLKFLKIRYSETEFMVITGYGSYENMVEIYLSGVTVTLIKPFEVTDLFRCIHYALQRKQINNRILTTITWLQKKPLKPSSTQELMSGKDLSALKIRIHGIEKLTGYYINYGRRMWALAQKIAGYLDLPPLPLKLLELACYVHHLGKMGFCYPVYLKEHPVNPAEQILLKKYPEESVRLLKTARLPEELYGILLRCEEHHDGSGYPCGLQENQIPLPAQILHFCTHVISLFPHNPLAGNHVDLPEVTGHIQSLAGTALPPYLVDIFTDITKGGKKETQIIQG